MTDAVIPSARRPSATAWLFALAVFVSAGLIFAVQPIMTRLVLPTLGGSPSVWNTAMVFFQAALLAGYGYAHGLQRLKDLRVQVDVHLGLLLLAGLVLPLGLSGALGDPDPARPILWLLGALTLSVGAPFAVLAGTAPLLQAWFARVRADHPEGRDPYVLYAASNLGSFAALLAYPTLLEPGLTLDGQTLGWTVGYGVFTALVVAVAWRMRRGDAGPAAAPLPVSPPIPWREKALWVALAAIPSSLMLGVTAYLSTDVASAPFLWVAPLALYLLTFVLAFQARVTIPFGVTLLVQAATTSACTAILPFANGDWAFLFLIHLVTFFFAALMCHQSLARRRPAPDRLTEFFLLLSLGGMLGGVFNALVAPVIFDLVLEYPLALALVALARPWSRERPQVSDWVWLAAAVLLALAPLLIYAWLDSAAGVRAGTHEWFSWPEAERSSRVLLSGAAICAFMARDQARLFFIGLVAVAFTGQQVALRYDWRETDRSFFGVMRIGAETYPEIGEVRILMHGTTLHGAQAVGEPYRCQPMLYYAPVTPIGQAMLAVQERGPITAGVVGQGAGSMAAYARPGDRLTFFEIDPLVDRWSRDPARFSFIDECAGAPVRTVLGDARLTLRREPEGVYDLLIIDAFSSDAVPTHLLTVEALGDYLRVLKPDGVVLLHLSNRNLEITTPAVAAARQLGLPTLHQIYIERPDALRMAEASTEALLIGRDAEALAAFADDPRWRAGHPSDTRPWTDDYVDLFGAVMRQIRR